MTSQPAIIYRPYRPSDVDAVLPMIDEAFGVRSRFPEPALAHLLRVDLEISLFKSTFSRVALRDGEIVGLILGRAKGQPKLPNPLRRLGAIALHVATSAPRARSIWAGLNDWRKEQLSYARATARARDRNTALDNELVLFIVSASTRGQGVGSQLFAAYTDYLRSCGQRDFFLYTDTDCTWQFYEARGMRRAGVSSYFSLIDETPREVENFVYTGSA